MSPTLVPSCGAWWGGHDPNGYASFEAQAGRRVGIWGDFYSWSQTALTVQDRTVALSGRLLRVNWQSNVSFASIANGSQDAHLRTFAASLRSVAPHKVFFSWMHEMERDASPGNSAPQYGSPAQFVAAWRHMHDVFGAAGATNVVWAWVTTGYSGWASLWPALYPGDAYVDWIGWDPYNWYTCHRSPWRSFGDVVSSMYGWLETHGHGNKPFMLGEYGSREGATSTAKQAWFASIPGTLRTQYPNLRALIYFNEATHDNAGVVCDWRVSSSSSSLAGFRAAGADPYLNP